MARAWTILALCQLASLLGECGESELVCVLAVIQLAVGCGSRANVILVAALVVTRIYLHFHCILLRFAKKLATLVMTFMCSQRSIGLSYHIRVIVTWAWCTSLRNRTACLTPCSWNGSQGVAKARISLLVLTDSGMLTFHWERTFPRLLTD